MVSLCRAIADVLSPRICPICGQVLAYEEYVCEPCFRRLERTEQAVMTENITEDLFYRERHFVRGGAWLFFHHSGPVRPLIHSLKFRDNPHLGEWLGMQAAREWLKYDFFDEIDYIVPVPLHPKRLRERGYNQAEYIAHGISRVTGIPVDTEHLFRREYTLQQALKDSMERNRNVQGVFVVEHPEEMFRKRLLLVDDVITTGATLRSCIQAFHAVRGCKITIFALAKTQNEISPSQ